MKNIDHIGIAVKQLSSSIQLFEQLLKTKCYKQETVQSEKVITAFFKTGETKIELLQDAEQTGSISNYIAKKGEGIHHIAFEVEDIYAEMQRLKQEGFILLSNEPKQGADDKLICFIHPKSANGVLIEICQQIKKAGDI